MPFSVSLNDLSDKTEDQNALKEYGLDIAEKIGEGCYGVIRICHVKKGGLFDKAWPHAHADIACKIINRRSGQRSYLERFLPRELEILGKLQHPNVVQTYSIISVANKVYITMELVNGGDLLKLVRASGLLSHNTSRKIFISLADAVSYLHSERIAHRDIKCENILLNRDKHVKLCDFGFARYTFDRITSEEVYSSTYCGSAAYAAPEILQGVPYNMKANDIWSMGVVLYIMITGNMPFGERNAHNILQKQKTRRTITINDCVADNESLRDLMLSLLEYDPSRRIKIADIYRKEWVKAIHQPSEPSTNKISKLYGPSRRI